MLQLLDKPVKKIKSKVDADYFAICVNSEKDYWLYIPKTDTTTITAIKQALGENLDTQERDPQLLLKFE